MQHFFYNKDNIAISAGEGISRKILSYTDNLMVCELTFEEGAVASLHSHYHEQQTYIVSGEFLFTIGDEQKVVGPGDCLSDEPYVIHGAVCLKAGKLIDIFTPARQDFLGGLKETMKKQHLLQVEREESGLPPQKRLVQPVIPLF